ncbi:MAG: FadR family transcriptional regulator [Streptomyces sp.]|uniref:FadR/GntR family transcriptional regulator n=1 Tax=Streptomyces sp. TaxID=1931 RepID=UPI0025D20A82|nr:FadR/GntR family transcriptional regulator [Streptomyces sp.]MBW8802134.1 FadR family transcriptional regulator [Streptomyces sp.]
MIVGGQLRPGDRLPREADLALQLGLSRNSLREAVRALSLINILDVRQGVGTYVTSLEPHLLLDALAFVLDFHRDDRALEFLRVRLILEPAAASMAAERGDETIVSSLRAVLDATRPDLSSADLLKHDIEFHHKLAEASGNSVLCSLIDSLADTTHRTRIWRGLTEEGAQHRTIAEHRGIIAAIEIGDGELAQARMLVHISGVEQWLQRVRIPKDG